MIHKWHKNFLQQTKKENEEAFFFLLCLSICFWCFSCWKKNSTGRLTCTWREVTMVTMHDAPKHQSFITRFRLQGVADFSFIVLATWFCPDCSRLLYSKAQLLELDGGYLCPLFLVDRQTASITSHVSSTFCMRWAFNRVKGTSRWRNLYRFP